MEEMRIVFILVTKNPNGGVDYRVRALYEEDADDLCRDADYPSAIAPLVNRKRMLQLFGTFKVDDAEAALRTAAHWPREDHRVGNNIKVLDFSGMFFPATDERRVQRRPRGHRGGRGRHSPSTDLSVNEKLPTGGPGHW